MSRARAGYSVLEVMVVLGVLIALVLVAVPAMNALTSVEQRRVAKQLSLTYTHLYDQAIMRNMTFRIGFHLTGGFYEVEVGDGQVLIFDDPEARETFAATQESKLSRFGEEGDGELQPSRFQKVAERFQGKVELPKGTVFGGLYTPQFGWVDPDDLDEDDGPAVVYSHLFATGFAEPTVVWIVSEDDPTDGYSVVVEPLSGVVTLHGELVDWEEAFGRPPLEGPNLP